MHLQHPRAFKSAISAAILAMTFNGSAMADKDKASSTGNPIQIYGRIDVSLDKTQAQVNSNASYGKPGASVQKLTDNTSRLGFRGTESLGAGNNAIYGLEFGINADEGSLVTPNFRYAYVGLQGQWGTFNMGRLDSSAPTGSPLYSQLAQNLRWIIHDAGSTAIGTRILNGNNRVSNAFTYKSPNFGPINVAGRVNFAGPEVPSTTNVNLKGEADFKQYQLAANYTDGKLSGGVGYGWDAKTGGFQVNDYKSKVQGVVSYNLGFMRPYFAMGNEKYNATTTTRDTVEFKILGATASLGTQGRITLNVMERSIQTDKNGSLKKAQGEYSYFLSKRSTLYVFKDHDVSNTNKANSTANSYGFGVMHQF
jgi:predicted porin